MLTELMHTSLMDISNRMQPITLAEMKGIRLMNRIDTKYLAPSNLLPYLLGKCRDDFRIQHVDGCTLSRYSTQYYDTKDLEMYTLHHNSKRPRLKVRLRTYVDSDIHFLEIKNKSNKGRTVKVRIQLFGDQSICQSLPCTLNDFLGRHTHYTVDDLIPHINTSFDRITLVNNNKSERVTIDTNLSFHNCRTGITKNIPELMIIELKQDGKVSSKLKDFLVESRVQPIGISKYCLGTILTDASAKSNRFKPKLRYIQKITHDQP